MLGIARIESSETSYFTAYCVHCLWHQGMDVAMYYISVLMRNVLCHWKEADFAPPLHKRAASISVPAYTFLSSVVFM